MADVGKVLERGVGIAVALEHDRLALIFVEEDFVLERAGVLGPHDLHGLFRQALPLRELAGTKLYPCDAFDLLHCCSQSKLISPGSNFGSQCRRSAAARMSKLRAKRCWPNRQVRSIACN